MNVDWNWIKQRPHFIAEGLANTYDMTVVYQFRYGRHKLQKRSHKGLSVKPIYVIPKISGIARLCWINDHILCRRVKKIIMRTNPDIVYATYPTHIGMIPPEYSGKVVYDCMDNHAAFQKNEKERIEMEEMEKNLTNRSTEIMFSSNYLKSQICKRYNISEGKTTVIRNAYSGKCLDISDAEYKSSVDKKFHMAYIGTISSWFDYETIVRALDGMPDATLHIYGPIERIEIPKTDRIIYHGTIEHNKLYEMIQGMDCLLMPFVVNEIVKAVDPVKIYEYINFNKNIIMCQYDEVERFGKFVYFYKNADEFVDAVKKIQSTNVVKYSNDERILFLSENNWDNRIQQIIGILER